MLGLFTAPLVILLHECGHYIVHTLQGHHPVLYSSMIWPTRFSPTRQGQLLGAIAGPAVEASFCAVGFIWLKLRRRGRVDAEPTLLDWVATSMALCCGRWLHHTPGVLWDLFRRGRSGSDEVGISAMLGLRPWVVPVVMFIPAACVLVATVRQHARSRRLVPFAGMASGGATGALLWLLVVGPALLGQQPDPFRLWRKTVVPPKVVSLMPANGAQNVNPALKEIRVYFDRPMRDNSWSLCGAGPHCPEGTGKPYYDSRHIVWSAPIELKPDWDYAFQLNSDEFKNFVSEEGVPLEPVLVRFRTANTNKFR
jgi:hypothetical protein